MSAILAGNGAPRIWEGSRDSQGHRDFNVTHIVEVTNPGEDGPFVVMQCAGLPQIGSEWDFSNDFDAWAFCWPDMTITRHGGDEGEPVKFFAVTQKFSTKPMKRCQDVSIEDPLLEPQKISGTFVNYTREETFDRFGQPITNSSWELIRGPSVEFDAHRHTVCIEQNVAALELELFTDIIANPLNDDYLWGLPPRCIKLSNVSWSRQIFGICNYYYTRKFDFDTDALTFDRDVLDEGTKVLNGHWETSGTAGGWVLDNIDGSAPNPLNPQHFIVAVDRQNTPCHVILDGHGKPWDAAGSGYPGSRHIEKYGESNLLELNIPTVL